MPDNSTSKLFSASLLRRTLHVFCNSGQSTPDFLPGNPSSIFALSLILSSYASRGAELAILLSGLESTHFPGHFLWSSSLHSWLHHFDCHRPAWLQSHSPLTHSANCLNGFQNMTICVPPLKFKALFLALTSPHPPPAIPISPCHPERFPEICMDQALPSPLILLHRVP